MGKVDSYSPEAVADRLAIQDVLYRYCRGIDRRNSDWVRSAFHPDAHDSHGVYNGDIEGFIRFFEDRHRFIDMSMHHIGNMLIEFVSPDTALVESYCFVTQRYRADEGAKSMRSAIAGGNDTKVDKVVDMNMLVRYVDRITKRNGEWKIIDRCTVWDQTKLTEVDPNGPVLPGDWPLGRRDDTDPLWERRRGLGL